MPTTHTITPCLWFDDQAEDAARFYTSIFPNSQILDVTKYSEAGQEVHGRKAGSVMVVEFELNGHAFTALNGGPYFKLSEALSLQVYCDTQAEIDQYWEKLSEGSDPSSQQCGWLKDKFGLSWQIVSRRMTEMLKDTASGGAQRAMQAILRMKKIDLAALQAAYAG